MNKVVDNVLSSDKEKWVERFARFGIIAKGVVYCLIGVLTVLTAFGLQNQNGTKTQALNVVYDQPFGKILLIIIAFGLAGYVTWRAFQAFWDIDHKGKGSKAIATRIGYASSALIYLALAVYAIRTVLNGPGSSGNGNSRRLLIEKVLEYPAGEWIVGIAALILAGNGIYQIYKGISGNFMKHVSLYNSNKNNIFKKAGVVGYIARGVVLSILGYFMLRAAIHSNPNEAQDTSGAFSFLQHTFGTTLMILIAVGLVLYGVFMFVKSKYQRIDFHF